MKNFITVIILIVTSLTGFSQRKAEDRPNIIIVYFDDMGYGDIEPYGMTGIPTPNFNKLAKEGIRFTHYNAAQAVCTASRASLLTGCYPNRLGMYDALRPWSTTALNPEEETIASLVKQKGYKTAMLGKWHLGCKAPFLPLHFGFDSFYGFPYSNDMWPRNYELEPVDNGFPPLPIIEGDKQIGALLTIEDQGLTTATLTEKAVNYIKENKKNPFFLYLAHPMPHIPLAASPRFKGKSEMGLFGDVIMELDWSVGEIMNTLDKEGISKNTILIVTSDNGPWRRFGNQAGSTGGFREGKTSAWEGGTRVPCFVRWPGKLEAGGVNSKLMVNIDILTTICAITGAPLPKKKIDGINMLSVLEGKAKESPRDVFYYYFSGDLKAIRYKNWKLVLPHIDSDQTSGLPGRDGHEGESFNVRVKMGLYDLAHDPGETCDVQAVYPEMVQKILLYAEEARKDLGDTFTNRKGANVREPGRPKL